jgi:membrane protein DedA with SNARE-associated domain
VLWNTALVYLGALAGNSWEKIAASFGTYSDIALMAILALVPVITLVVIRRKQKKQ